MPNSRTPSSTSVSVICEIASAHGGNPDELVRLLEAADSADADWVKVQIYDFKSLVAGENVAFSDLKTIEIAPREWEKILAHAMTLRPRLIAEVFDAPSLDLVARANVAAAYKIPTADLGDHAFVDGICKLGKPVFIGVGGATVQEIDAIVARIRNHPGTELTLLHGFQNFPTRLEDSILSRIPWLRLRYGCPVGFADHVDSEDKETARTLPAMALAAGASVIEKHMTLVRAKRGFDYYSSLNPDEFEDFVQHIRRVHAAIGQPDGGNLSAAEIAYRHKMKKFAVSVLPIEAGTKVGAAQLEFRRTSVPGLSRDDIADLSASEFACNVPAGTVIGRQHLDRH